MILLLTLGCALDEHLPQVDISGTVVVPRAAATRTYTDPLTGEATEIVDVRNIGPVVIGAYPAIRDDLFAYPHPEMGPVIDQGIPGNAYPYGGGTVGRFDFACFEHLACRVSTGRFKDYDDVLDWFGNVIDDPVKDEFGFEVESSDFYRDYCYDLFEVTADYEISWVSGADGLDFVVNDDGDFEAQYNLWQVTYFEGMQLWGFVDSPSERFNFTTCDDTRGQQNSEYVNDYFYGTGRFDLLNFPANYISDGDFVVGMDDVVTLSQVDADAYREAAETPMIRIGFEVGAEEEAK